jgi:pimeloyl-ACP methyl ester carboxylesterase
MKIENALVAAHRQAGRFFQAGGIQGFVREQGQGEAVVCMHGVPSSSFLYRKVLAGLAENGFKGVAFDLPGLGLSDRPTDVDYTWTGLGKWSTAATEALGLDKYHLIIHDLGGPVGLEMLAAHPERILSLTILNTLTASVGSFSKPWIMRPFEWPLIGDLYVGMMMPILFQQLMYLQGVQDKSVFGRPEAEAYMELLKTNDGGKAFLRMMRCFETTREKEQLYVNAVRKLTVPKQVIWGANDPALSLKKHGYRHRDAMEIQRFFTVPGKHFLQEDCAPAIVEHVVAMNRESATSV